MKGNFQIKKIGGGRIKNDWNKISVVVSLLIFFIVLTTAFCVMLWRDKEPAQELTENLATTTFSYKYFSKLTGLGVLEEKDISPEIIGVMLDTHPDALPMSGVNEAAIIYEAPVEGPTTRLFAIYPRGQEVGLAGPVRSARPYFLDWLAEYGDALYMHCGGSPDALDLIKERKIFNINEFYWAYYYWRDNNRIAPYNLFTTSEQWNLILEKYGAKHPGWSWDGWKFSDEISATSSEPVKEIKIYYGIGFEVVWKYNAENYNYERWLNGDKFLDGNNQAITAENILIQYTSMIILDDIGRRKIETIGNGEARVLRRGEMIRGKWQKDGRPERTRFYNKEGIEINLTPGKTWIMVVPDSMSLGIVSG